MKDRLAEAMADHDERMREMLAAHYKRENDFEASRKGTWTACRVPDGPHRGDLSEYGWCEGHKYPSDRCNVVRNGDSYICRYHNRQWRTGICPGLRGPLG